MTTKREGTETKVSASGEAPEGNGARTVPIPRVLTVKELGELLGISPVEVIKDLMKNGVMASINQNIDFETAAIVAHDLGFEPEEAETEETEEAALADRPKAGDEEEEEASHGVMRRCTASEKVEYGPAPDASLRSPTTEVTG